MITDACFWTPKENFEKIIEILKKDFGLVGPRNDAWGRTEKDILVKEADYYTGVYGGARLGDGEPSKGIYRVHFQYDHKPIDVIMFSYWNETIPKSKQEDIMAAALLKIYNIIEPIRVTDSCHQEINNLEEKINSEKLEF